MRGCRPDNSRLFLQPSALQKSHAASVPYANLYSLLRMA